MPSYPFQVGTILLKKPDTMDVSSKNEYYTSCTVFDHLFSKENNLASK